MHVLHSNIAVTSLSFIGFKIIILYRFLNASNRLFTHVLDTDLSQNTNQTKMHDGLDYRLTGASHSVSQSKVNEVDEKFR